MSINSILSVNAEIDSFIIIINKKNTYSLQPPKSQLHSLAGSSINLPSELIPPKKLFGSLALALSPE